MGTAYDTATALLASLVSDAATESLTLPTVQYVVTGEPVVDCPSVIVALTGINIPEGFTNAIHCAPPQLGSFDVIIARDCGTQFTPDGSTIPSAADTIAAAAAADGDFLWGWASRYAEVVDKTWELGFVTTGGLAITSLLLTTGVQ